MKAATDKIFTVLAVFYGAFWLIFGLNGFLHFFAVPEPPAKAAAFLEALQDAGYVMPLVYAAQIVAGLFLLSRRFVPLALILLGPVIANIVLYDLLLNPGGLAIGLVLCAFYTYFVIENRKAFTPLFTIHS